VSYSGGIADKTGNIYEAKWVVRQLLDVLRGEAEAVRFESIRREDQGFEFSVERNGVTEHHQSKLQTSNGNWTLLRLEREGVLTAFKAKLAASHTERCVFVSQSPTTQLNGLIGEASLANNAKELEESLGEQDSGNLAEIRRIWATNPDLTFQWLRRVEVRVIPETEIDGLIDSYIRITFNESSKVTFPDLRAFLENRMNRRITTDNGGCAWRN
jgi:hypothetical protein